MTIEPLLFIEFLVIIFVLAVAIVVLVVSYSNTIKKLHSVTDKEEKLEGNLHKEERHVISNAHHKANLIIEDAQKKAQEIIQDADVFADRSRQTLESHLTNLRLEQTKSFARVTDEYLKVYEDMLDSLKKEDINIFKNVSKNIEDRVASELLDFRKIIQQETIDSQKIVGEKIDAEYAKIAQEVDSYKAGELKKVDESIYKILRTVSADVIGKALTLEQHEGLVVEALEKAKKSA